jgi:hypothetical protein
MAAVLDRIKEALGGTSPEDLEHEIADLDQRSRALQRSRRRFRERSRNAIDELIKFELQALEQARDELIGNFQACDPGPSPMKESIIGVGLRYLALTDPRFKEFMYAGASSSSAEWADVTLEDHERELGGIRAEIHDRRIELERREVEDAKKAAADREAALSAKAGA